MDEPTMEEITYKRKKASSYVGKKDSFRINNRLLRHNAHGLN
ncbi:hypothetical protein [Clostridium sp.]|jgi:hypothetical protein